MENKWTQEEIDILLKSLDYNLEERLKMLPNRTKSSISTKIYDLKLKTRNRKFSKDKIERLRLERKSRMTEIIENSFVDISTPETAYILGILWGDGCLYNGEFEGRKKYIYMGILKTDFDDIRHLFDSKWIMNNRKRKNKEKIISEIKNHDINFTSFLFKNQYHKKSLISPNKILNCIPENLKHYFWRGYSDADGCFYISKNFSSFQYNLAGTLSQDWTDFEHLLKSLDIKYSVRRVDKKTKYSVVRFCKKSDFVKFGEYIYKGNIFGLIRKYEKFQLATSKIH